MDFGSCPVLDPWMEISMCYTWRSWKFFLRENRNKPRYRVSILTYTWWVHLQLKEMFILWLLAKVKHPSSDSDGLLCLHTADCSHTENHISCCLVCVRLRVKSFHTVSDKSNQRGKQIRANQQWFRQVRSETLRNQPFHLWATFKCKILFQCSRRQKTGGRQRQLEIKVYRVHFL